MVQFIFYCFNNIINHEYTRVRDLTQCKIFIWIFRSLRARRRDRSDGNEDFVSVKTAMTRGRGEIHHTSHRSRFGASSRRLRFRRWRALGRVRSDNAAL